MEGDSSWKRLFEAWPKELPPRGVLVTKFQEQIPFEGFMASDAMLLVERKTPDTNGARKVLMPFAEISAIKFVDVVRGKLFEPLGFAGKLKD